MARIVAGNRFIVKDFGTCLQFNGTNTKVVESSTSAATTSTPITVACWFRNTKAASGNAVSQVLVVSKYVYMHIRLVSGLASVVVRYDETSGRSATSAGLQVNDTRWHHAVGTFNPTGGSN